MIKRVLGLLATVALVLALGAGVSYWRAEGLSLVADCEAAIIFDRAE